MFEVEFLAINFSSVGETFLLDLPLDMNDLLLSILLLLFVSKIMLV